jgi:hypothetical protein
MADKTVTIYGVEVTLPELGEGEVVTDVVLIAQSTILDDADWDRGSILRGSSKTAWSTRIGLLKLALSYEMDAHHE